MGQTSADRRPHEKSHRVKMNVMGVVGEIHELPRRHGGLFGDALGRMAI